MQHGEQAVALLVMPVHAASVQQAGSVQSWLSQVTIGAQTKGRAGTVMMYCKACAGLRLNLWWVLQRRVQPGTVTRTSKFH